MSTKDSGGPAFPTGDSQDSKLGANYGMSLRDYFAAKAMQALVSGLCAADGRGARDWLEADIWAPAAAYRIADAMLKERDK